MEPWNERAERRPDDGQSVARAFISRNVLRSCSARRLGRARFLSRRVSPLVAYLIVVLEKLGLTSSRSLTVTPGTCVHEEIDDTYIHAWTKRSLSYVSVVDASSFSLVSWWLS